MSIDLRFAFVAASVVLLLDSGPTILTVVSYSVAHGSRADVPLVAAVALGDSTALRSCRNSSMSPRRRRRNLTGKPFGSATR